jgi:ribosomal protein S21
MSKHFNGPFDGKRGMSVDVRNGNVESAIRLLGRKVKQEGVLRDVRARQYYEKPSVKRNKKKIEARIRWLKNLSRMPQ